MKSKKWTREACHQEALKYNSKSELRKKNGSVYTIALKNDWLKDYTWFKPLKREDGYWTYERCFEEAKKYTTKSEFKNGHAVAYGKAWKNDWLKDYTWFVDGKETRRQKKTKWTYEKCFEEAKKYTTKTEFQNRSSKAYSAANHKGWLKDYIWFVDGRKIVGKMKTKWNYDTCMTEAKKYTTIADFVKGCGSAYGVARINGWLEEYTWLERKPNKHDEPVHIVYAYFFREQKAVYIGRTVDKETRQVQHRKDGSPVYKFARAHKSPVPNMTILESGLTLDESLDKEHDYVKEYRANEEWDVLNKGATGRRSGSIGGLGSGKRNYTYCYNEAKKYTTLKEYRTNSHNAYQAALKKGWLGDYTWLKTTIHHSGYWTYERCFEEAKKFNTKKQFQSGNAVAYGKALKEKWIDDYVWLEVSFRWNYENCFEEAKKYTTLKEYRTNSHNAYYVSLKKGWLGDYTWLKKGKSRKKVVIKYTLSGEIIAQYNGVSEAVKLNGYTSKSGIINCCLGINQTYKGFIWKYGENE